jgi:hypothetical protein
MIGLGSFFIAAAMVAPSFAAKQAVSDDELDMVTAAGQPVAITAGNTSTVSFSGATTIQVTIQTGSQTNLRALALNNVVGENQVANGINIQGGSSGTGSQTNAINQSWGSTSDITIVSTPGLTASASPVCTGLICKGGIQVATVGGVARRLSRTADQIIEVGSTSTVTYNPATTVGMSIDGGSQTGLVALVVNNVAGLNQVSNGVNLLAGTVTLGGSPASLSAVGGNGTITGATQSNSLGAWRGTPQNFTRIP